MNELKKIFELDTKIDKNFRGIRFKNEAIENKYINSFKVKFGILMILCFILMSIVYITIISTSFEMDDEIYSRTIFFIWRRHFTIITFVLDFISNIGIFINYKFTKSLKFKFRIIFFRNIFLSICLYMSSIEYFILYKNPTSLNKHFFINCTLNRIFYLLVNKNSILFFSILFSMNLFYLTSTKMILKENILLMEIIGDLILEIINFLVIFIIKWKMEISERKVFSEKYFLKDFYRYFQGILKTFNCLHFSFLEKKLIYSNLNLGKSPQKEINFNLNKNKINFSNILRDGDLYDFDKNQKYNDSYEDNQIKDKEKIYEKLFSKSNFNLKNIAGRRSSTDINANYNLPKKENLSNFDRKLFGKINKEKLIYDFNFQINSQKKEKNVIEFNFINELLKTLKKSNSIKKSESGNKLFDTTKFDNLYEFNQNNFKKDEDFENKIEKTNTFLHFEEENIKNKNLDDNLSVNHDGSIFKEEKPKINDSQIKIINPLKDENFNIINESKNSILNRKGITKNKKNTLNHKEFVYIGEFISSDINLKIDNNTDDMINYYDVYFRRFSNITDYLIIDKTNKKLIEKNCMENSIKHNIFAKLAHEFKTPLNSIISLIGNIKNYLKLENEMSSDSLYIEDNEESCDINLKKDLNVITGLSNYTLYLISDIIQYSVDKNEKKSINISYQEVKLKKILHFNFEILKALISCHEEKDKMIKTIIDIDEFIENVIIKTDEFRLNQIMLNLISNAVKFTKMGSIKIKAELKIFDEQNKYFILLIHIQDTGIGIKENQKELIFKESNNLDINYEVNKMGTGLGLSICYQLAKMLDYKISFKSEESVGTGFFIEISDSFLIMDRNLIGKKTNSNEGNANDIKIMETGSLVNSKGICDDVKYKSYDSDYTKIYSLDLRLPSNFREFSKFHKSSSGKYDTIQSAKINEKIKIVQNVNYININNNLTYREDDNNIRKKRPYYEEKFSFNDKRIYRNSLLSNETTINLKKINDNKLNNIKISERFQSLKKSKENLDFSFLNNTRLNDGNLPEIKMQLVPRRKIISSRTNVNSSIMTENTNKFTNAYFKRKNKLKVDNNVSFSIFPFQNNTEKKNIYDEFKIIIIIDDNKFIRSSIISSLEKILIENKLLHLFKIVEGKDGIDLLRFVIDINYIQKIRLIITDENMEYMQGSTAIKFIRIMEKLNKIPQHIIFSASSIEDYTSEKNIISAGANKIISKPFTKEKLSKEMKEFNLI